MSSRSASQPSRTVPAAVFILGAAGLLASAAVLDRNLREGARDRAGAELDAVALLKAGALEDHRETLERTAASLGDSLLLQRAAGGGAAAQAVFGAARERLAREAERQGLVSLALVADGEALVDAQGSGSAVAGLDGALVAEALTSGRPAVSRLRAELSEGRARLDVAAALRTGPGRARAVVYLRRDLSSFLDELSASWPVPNRTGETVIVRRDGEAALFITAPRRREGWRMRMRVPLLETRRGLVRAVLGERGVFQAVDYRDEPILLAVRPVEGSDWLVLTRFDVAELEAPVARTVGAVLGALALLLLSGAAALVLWYRREDRQHRALAAASRALEEGEARLRLALAGTTFVWEWDLAAGRLTADADWLRALAAPPEGVAGSVEEVVRVLVAEEDRGVVRAQLEAHLHGRAPLLEVEFRGAAASGELRWFAIRGRVSARDVAGRPLRAMGVVSDVTAGRRVREQLERSERLVSLGTLAAGVAHEINNPLTYVLDAVGRLADELPAALPARPDLGEAAAHARDGARRVRDVVQRLRAFSRPGAERRGPVDVDAEVAAAVRLAGNELRHRARVEVRAGAAPRVVASEHQLGQVFLNLLLNAAHAVEAAARPERLIEVEVGTDRAGWARVEVRDNGVGIPAGVLPHIFEPFFTTRGQASGTGLGLAIAWAEVAAAGGRIEVESEEGRGSLFRVLLPPAPPGAVEGLATPATAAHPAVVPTPVRALAPATTPAPEAAPARGRPRVLVVDDDPLVARSIARAVGRAFEVEVAGSGAEALERLAGRQYEAVVCDLMMPGMTGMELHARVAVSDPRLAGRFVFVTGGAFTEAARAFLDASAAPRVEKPFEPQRLRRAVEEIVGGAPPGGG